MSRRLLEKIRARVLARAYVLTDHAEQEMDEDGLSVFDVESAILTGRIIERQRDRRTREAKYVIKGSSVEGEEEIVTVVKLGPTGKTVILTVYVE